MKHIFLLLALSAVVASCSHKAEHVEKAFYYWKNNEYNLNEYEGKLLDTLKVKKLYVKFFEVEKNDVMGNIPVAKTEIHLYNNLEDVNLVPTVYIRNEVFKKCTKQSLDTLADNVSFLLNKYRTDKFKWIKNVDEYQMDCDWTISTKDNYFYFLKKLKQLSGKTISCTLRLYPYKYPDKMGVPPVDKAMLMCYNLIKPLEDHGRNSILDNDELSAYLNTDEKYPVHLDIALPVYSWVQVYQNNHFQKLLYTDTKNIKSILKPEKPLWYEVRKDTVIDDFYLRVGDKVKIEEMSSKQLQEAIDIIKRRVKLDETITVSLFHLDEQQLKNYRHEEITGFYSRFTE